MAVSITELSRWKDVITSSNIWIDAGHTMAWGLVKGLAWLVDATENLVTEVYDFLDFTKLTMFQEFFGHSNAKMLLMVLFSVAILGLALFFTFNHGDKKAQIMQNAMIVLTLLFVLPTGMDTLNQMTKAVNNMDILQSDSSSSTSADSIIANGVVDLMYLDMKGFENYTVDGSAVLGNGVARNAFSRNSAYVRTIDVNEVITNEDAVRNEEYLFNKIEVDSNGRLQKKPIEKTKYLGIDFTPWVYRYKIDFFSIILTLAASAIAFCFVAYKVVKMIYELAVSPIIAVITGASDMISGQRVKEAIKNIVASYAVLMLIPILMKVYFLAQSFIVQNFSNAVVKTFLLVCCSLALIDGPNLVQRVFGIDAGMKSAFQTLASAFMISRAVGAGGKTMVNATKGAVGAAAGFSEAIKDRKGDSAARGSEIANAGTNETNADTQTQTDLENSNAQDTNSSVNQNGTSRQDNKQDIKNAVNADGQAGAMVKDAEDGSLPDNSFSAASEISTGTDTVNDSTGINDAAPEGGEAQALPSAETPLPTDGTAQSNTADAFHKAMDESVNSKLDGAPPELPNTPVQTESAEKNPASPKLEKQNSRIPPPTTRGYENWVNTQSPYYQGKRKGYSAGSLGRGAAQKRQQKNENEKGEKE